MRRTPTLGSLIAQRRWLKRRVGLHSIVHGGSPVSLVSVALLLEVSVIMYVNTYRGLLISVMCTVPHLRFLCTIRSIRQFKNDLQFLGSAFYLIRIVLSASLGCLVLSETPDIRQGGLKLASPAEAHSHE